MIIHKIAGWFTASPTEAEPECFVCGGPEHEQADHTFWSVAEAKTWYAERN